MEGLERMRKPGPGAGWTAAFAILFALTLAGPAAADVPLAAADASKARTGKDAVRWTRVGPRKQSRMNHLHHTQEPTGMYGRYPLGRESSGTSWQPESSIHEGLHTMSGEWFTMVHAWATAVWDDQRGPRGADDFYSANMMMARAHGPLGPGTIGFRAMFSAEPGTIGREGYPLLLQTGETADGVTPLIDRQHPHDMVMELATTFSTSPGENSSLFVYAGLPGEPALGPPVFMHRFSGEAFPDAPIGHHWLDSTHITYGVLTGGLTDGPWKLEGSMFRGREPDQDRLDIEHPELDSHSFRLSYNANENLAVQASYGRLHSPEALEPDVDVDRTTVSVIVNSPGPGRVMQTTMAWGRNHERPGSKLDAFLLETTTNLQLRHTLMMRIEQTEKGDLYPPGHARAGQVFQVEKLSGGYRFDVWPRGPVAVGVGGLASLSRVPQELETDYGGRPFGGMLYVRAELR